MKIRIPVNFIFEFFAVLLGIFGAFWLQNLNEESERKALIKEIMSEIKLDLEEGLLDLKADLSFHRQGLYSTSKLINALRSPNAYADSLCFDFYFLKADEYSYPQKTGFNRIQNLSLSSDIFNRLGNIYESLYPRIAVGNGFQPDIDDYFEDFYLDHFKYNQDSTLSYTLVLAEDTLRYPVVQNIFGNKIVRTIGYHPLNFDELKHSKKFESMMLNALEFRIYKYNRYGYLIKEIEELVKIIEEDFK